MRGQGAEPPTAKGGVLRAKPLAAGGKGGGDGTEPPALGNFQ